MLEELQEDSHSHRRVRKGSSIAERSAGKRSKPSAPLSARKNLRSTRQPGLTIIEEGDSDGSAGESEEAGRAIVQELVLDRGWLVEYKLGIVQEFLMAQGWGELFQKPVIVDEKLVKEFYSKLKLVEKTKGNLELSVIMGGDLFTLNLRELATILQVPKGGYAEYTKGTWPSSVAKLDVFKRLGMDPALKGQREVFGMDVLLRILHRILVSNITPRKQKHNLVVFQDILLVDQILQKKQVSLAFQVMCHMDYNKENLSNGMPFPGFVKEIMKYWEIYNPTSEKAFSSVFGDEQIIKLDLEYVAGEGWIIPRAQSPTPTEPVETEVSPVAVPVSQVTVLPADGLGELLMLLKEVRLELKEVKSELMVVKEKLAAQEVAVEVDSGAVSAVVDGLPMQIKNLATEIVEQLKVPPHNDT